MVIYMKIRLGYVAISKCFESSFKTINYTNYLKYEDRDKRLDEIIKYNLNHLLEILKYNKKNNIHFYRISSNIVPLASHKDVDFDYITPYKNYYKKIANFIKDNNLRVDMHPSEYVILNSTNKVVIENSIRELIYHFKFLGALEIEDKLLIVHTGSSTLGKKNSITRFINNFNKLPSYLKEIIAIENDDKVYNIEDVIYICKQIGTRMILDYHHYLCNKQNYIKDLYKDIFNTFKHVPKMHFSSPKSKIKKDMRAHHDYIDSDSFISCLESIKNLNYDIDIMLEAKMKDDALFRLVRELKYKTNYKFIDETSFYI